MSLALVILLLQLPSAEMQKYEEIDTVLNKSYNHSRLLSADREAQIMARHLAEKFPDDPYVYNLWASAEWLLIGRELALRADERKDIAEISGYKERSAKYREMVEKGLSLTKGKSDLRSLFLRAALMFDHAKFSARYESRLAGLKRADQEAAEGIGILKKILETDPDFCSAYFLMGGNRLQLSTKTTLANRLFVWALSNVYSELHDIDSDVFNEKKSIEWLEKAYRCGYPQPWLKKTWLETSFLLAGAYLDLGKQLGIKEEMAVLQKELPLLQKLLAMFPQNQDVDRILKIRTLRLKILENFFSKK